MVSSSKWYPNGSISSVFTVITVIFPDQQISIKHETNKQEYHMRTIFVLLTFNVAWKYKTKLESNSKMKLFMNIKQILGVAGGIARLLQRSMASATSAINPAYTAGIKSFEDDITDDPASAANGTGHQVLSNPGTSQEQSMQSGTAQHQTAFQNVATPRMEKERSSWPPRRSSPPPAVPSVSQIPFDGSKPVLVLDMDETLVHLLGTLVRAGLDIFGLMENLTFKIGFEEYFVVKRPGVDSFLQKMKEHFNLVLWTAGTQEYADHVVDWLDPAGEIFYRRMYRQHCTFDSCINNYVKNLQHLGIDLSKVLILENREAAYMYQPKNGVPIVDFKGDGGDREFLCGTYESILIEASKKNDLRDGISEEFREHVFGKSNGITVGYYSLFLFPFIS